MRPRGPAVQRRPPHVPPWQLCAGVCTDPWLQRLLRHHAAGAGSHCPRYRGEPQYAGVSVAPEIIKVKYYFSFTVLER